MAHSLLSQVYQYIPLSSMVAALAFISLVYLAVSSVRSYKRLSHIPGPPLAAWTTLWWVRAAVSGRGYLDLHDAIQNYGPLVRVGPNTLVTCDTDLIRKMNAVRTPYNKSEWYKGFRFDADRENVFSETDKERHANMRSKITTGYSGKDNLNLEPDIDKTIMTLINLIKTKYLSDGKILKPLNLGHTLQYLTLDIITALSLGQALGWLEADDDKYAYNKTMADNLPSMGFMAAVPFLSRLVRTPILQRALLPSVKDKIGMGKVKSVAHEIIAQRFRPGDDKVVRNDMTQSFIEHGLTQAEIADESLLQILAGSDTSGTVMRSMFVFISTNPRIYNRLKAEVMSIDVPLDQVISHAESQKLSYLNACIKETMRYYPVNAGLGPRTVGPEGDEYNGMHLPPSTDIGVSAWDVYRHNPVYGIDAATFRPDRWLEADPDTLAKMEREHELVFMYGRFKCLGERIAWIEIRKTMFELLRRFDFSLLDPIKPLTREDNYGIWVQEGVEVRVEETKPTKREQ